MSADPFDSNHEFHWIALLRQATGDYFSRFAERSCKVYTSTIFNQLSKRAALKFGLYFFVLARNSAFQVAMEVLNSEKRPYTMVATLKSTECDWQLGQQAAETLLRPTVIPLLIGGVGPACSDAAMSAGRVFVEQNYPLVSFAATSESLSNRINFPTIFRTVYISRRDSLFRCRTVDAVLISNQRRILSSSVDEMCCLVPPTHFSLFFRCRFSDRYQGAAIAASVSIFHLIIRILSLLFCKYLNLNSVLRKLFPYAN